MKSQTVAGIWCFFLGGFGAHRFYLGKVVSGIFYVLFCWTLIPGIIASIEMLMIAFGSQQKWADKYNSGVITPSVHWLIKVLAILPALAFIGGILAAIAGPLAHDYEVRSHEREEQRAEQTHSEKPMQIASPAGIASLENQPESSSSDQNDPASR